MHTSNNKLFTIIGIILYRDLWSSNMSERSPDTSMTTGIFMNFKLSLKAYTSPMPSCTNQWTKVNKH